VVESVSEIVTKKQEWVEPLKLELQHFASSIREGREPAVTAEDGLRALKICDAVLYSAGTGEVVRLTMVKG
jgi:predicted dehydrogenase